MTNDNNGASPEDKAHAEALAKKMADELAREMDGVPEHLRAEAEAVSAAADELLDTALASLRSDLDAAKQDVLYAQAETQNVRRRMEKDVQDARNYATTGFARDILSVADNLGRAIDAVPAELRESEALKNFVAGIEATQRELDKIFAQHGVQKVATIGQPLDPHVHQAVMEVEAGEGHVSGTIVSELQAGYTIKDRLLRPAMVTVAK